MLSRLGAMRSFVDEVDRLYVYSPDPSDECLRSTFPEPGSVIDVDDACAAVASLAWNYGIPCRIVAARYATRRWTLFVAYQDEDGSWAGIYPLRQKTDHIVIEELVWT
jgi:hypothetical protein